MNEASLEQLEESLRGHESLSGVDNFNELTKKFIENGETIKTLQGNLEGKVAIPKEDSSDEDRTAFFKALGRPDNPAGYTLERPQMPEGMPYDEVLEQKFRQEAFDIGLNPSQISRLYKMFNDYGIASHTEILKSITENREKSEDLLKDTWKGEAYTANKEKAFRAFKKFGGDEGKEWAETNGIGDDPLFLQIWHKVYEAMGDDQFIEGQPAGHIEQVEGRLKFPSMGDK
jgi:hypothetical protein